MTPPQTDSGSPPCKPVLALGRVSYHVGRTPVLHDLTLTVNPGEFLGVLGPNGAGKSTLLSVAGATLRPTAGRAQLLGEEVWSLRESARTALRARVGTVLQHNEFNPIVPMTARDVVAIGRAGRRGLRRPLRREDHAEIQAALHRMGVSGLGGRTYRSLSGGERQKVQLARALAQQPELLLLDEPTTGLDMDWQERLVHLIGSLYERTGMAMVMTTHLTGHLPACCRRVVLMDVGATVFDGPIQEAMAPRRLSELFGCRIEVIRRGGRWHCHSTGDLAP